MPSNASFMFRGVDFNVVFVLTTDESFLGIYMKSILDYISFFRHSDIITVLERIAVKFSNVSK